MNQEDWDIMLGNVEKNYDVLDKGTDEDYGVKTQWIEFVNPLGKLRLEWTEKPRMSGRDSKNTYSEESKPDKISFVKAFKFNDEKEDWEEIKGDGLF